MWCLKAGTDHSEAATGPDTTKMMLPSRKASASTRLRPFGSKDYQNNEGRFAHTSCAPSSIPTHAVGFAWIPLNKTKKTLSGAISKLLRHYYYCYLVIDYNYKKRQPGVAVAMTTTISFSCLVAGEYSNGTEKAGRRDKNWERLLKRQHNNKSN